MLFFVNPYLVQMRFICKGQVLEVGSGIGRNLRVLKRGSLGVDHNKFAVKFAQSKGLKSLTVDEFIVESKNEPIVFNTLLVSHVLEHIDIDTQDEIFKQFMPHIMHGGKIVLVCPQEAGFNSDPTHIRWVDENILRKILEFLGCEKIKITSFPFPRWAGRKFIYNQTVATGILKSQR